MNRMIFSGISASTINLEKSVGSRKATQATDAPGKPEKSLITSKVTTSFPDSPCTPIFYVSFSRPTDFSRLNSALTLCILVLVSGCSLMPNNEDDYTKSRANPTLEEPPEISLPTPNAAYKIPKSAAPKVESPQSAESGSSSEKIELRRDGSLRWLDVPIASNEVWQMVVAFWKDQDVKLAESDAKLAMLETEWIESKAGIPTEGLKGLLKKAVGSDSDLALRDKYRLRIRTENNASQIYLTHRGAVLTHAKGDTPHWEMRQPEPEREAEMLRRLQLFLSHQ
ncbi:MAG TPA: hypothetical protein DD827_02115 [Gammaproteobacteria bacterium]|nr:hypothetical protein [Gammaproteobacteria bacterium]